MELFTCTNNVDMDWESEDGSYASDRWPRERFTGYGTLRAEFDCADFRRMNIERGAKRWSIVRVPHLGTDKHTDIFGQCENIHIEESERRSLLEATFLALHPKAPVPPDLAQQLGRPAILDELDEMYRKGELKPEPESAEDSEPAEPVWKFSFDKPAGSLDP